MGRLSDGKSAVCRVSHSFMPKRHKILLKNTHTHTLSLKCKCSCILQFLSFRTPEFQITNPSFFCSWMKLPVLCKTEVQWGGKCAGCSQPVFPKSRSLYDIWYVSNCNSSFLPKTGEMCGRIDGPEQLLDEPNSSVSFSHYYCDFTLS